MGVQAMQSIARGAAPAVLQRVIDIALGKVAAKTADVLKAADIVLTRAYGPAKTDRDNSGAPKTGFVALLPMPMADAELWANRYDTTDRELVTIEHQRTDDDPAADSLSSATD
jgi:hypothetical protein